MTISKLIKKLETLKDKYGDVVCLAMQGCIWDALGHPKLSSIQVNNDQSVYTLLIGEK